MGEVDHHTVGCTLNSEQTGGVGRLGGLKPCLYNKRFSDSHTLCDLPGWGAKQVIDIDAREKCNKIICASTK